MIVATGAMLEPAMLISRMAMSVARGDVESGFVHHDDSVLRQCSKKAVAGVEVRRRLPERWAVIRKPGANSPLVVNNERAFFRRSFRPACAIHRLDDQGKAAEARLRD
jgi:hypothetical protein